MKLDWRGALGIAVGLGFIYWTLRGVDIGLVWNTLRESSPLYFALSTLFATLIFPLRAVRWKVILDPVKADVPFGPLWRSTAIGMMVNNVAPARAGEPARAYALTREVPGIGFSAALASLAVDRLFDLIVIVGLGLVALLDPRFPSDAKIFDFPPAQIATGSLATIALGLIGLYSLAMFPGMYIRAFELFARRVSPRIEERGRDALVTFSNGLGALRSPRRFIVILFWTIIHWLTNSVAFWFGFKAVGIDAPFTAALFLQLVIGAGVAIPTAPGFFGSFELFAKGGLKIYDVAAPLAISWAIGFHILSFIPITLIGTAYFIRLGLHFRDVERARVETA
jgi:glycosyltransferase 2 family protein